MGNFFCIIQNIYFFPFIFAFNSWKSKRSLIKKILLLFLDLFFLLPLWIAGWLLFFFLIVIVFYIFDRDFKNVTPMLFLFLLLGLIIPTIYLVNPIIKYFFRIRWFRRIFLILLPFFAIYMVVVQFVIDLKQIIGNSMYPALKNGDYILINTYYRNYQRGDIIIFKHPKDPDLEYVSRLIALSKDRIKIQGGRVYLNEDLLNEKYVETSTDLWDGGCIQNNISYNVPQDYIFVMGDNRSKSSDSREYCAIPSKSIIGKYAYK